MDRTYMRIEPINTRHETTAGQTAERYPKVSGNIGSRFIAASRRYVDLASKYIIPTRKRNRKLYGYRRHLDSVMDYIAWQPRSKTETVDIIEYCTVITVPLSQYDTRWKCADEIAG